MIKNVSQKIKEEFLIEKDIQKELNEIKKIVKSREDDDVKFESIQAILNELAKEISEAKAGALFESRTGLYSAKFGEDFLEKEIDRSRRSEKSFSIALLDIDFLKYINDNFGHVTGTKVIIEVARIIKESVRKSDIVSRYGGDEFLLIFPNSDYKTAEKALERIKKEVAKLLIDKRVRVSLTIGVASFDGSPRTNPEKLISMADSELYRAKKDRVNLNEG